ncbi:hypothetical protein OCS_02017 [Ophiocordyceps sinensis CO18]|uniref:Uncharacterized protein n=1 Tax=Ophiocordyceps sinensis (strain Co18 / CGMCC 3.14243) TaxID=911162 RepID=T5AKC8_OPHSC|nr:hypothetical protein OCS_02017 [Ophiocordyceps sinensis CO18]
MARFVDLEAEPEAADVVPWPAASGGDGVAQASTADGRDKSRDNDSSDHAGTRPRVQNVITQALGCYPIVIAVASHIDLNTLDALARVCRGIHDGLIQYRSILLTSTLHCSSEATPVNRDALLRYRARACNWHYMEDGRSVNGKSGDCARDMVQECKRCSEVNCAIKPPAPVALRERHRRLCTTCARAPLATFLGPHLDTCASLGSEAVHRAICSCDTRGVWLCQPCGRGIRNTDHEYQQYASLASALVGEDGLVQLTQCHFKLSRIWHWRSHYGETLGGLGTGIGDGDRGVTCGRERRCLAAREIEHEVDCDAEDARWYGEPWSTTTSGSPPVSAAARTQRHGSS